MFINGSKQGKNRRGGKMITLTKQRTTGITVTTRSAGWGGINDVKGESTLKQKKNALESQEAVGRAARLRE